MYASSKSTSSPGYVTWTHVNHMVMGCNILRVPPAEIRLASCANTVKNDIHC